MESVTVQGAKVQLLRPPYPARVLVGGEPNIDFMYPIRSYGWWARSVAAVYGSFVYPLHGMDAHSVQQSLLHQALRRNRIKFTTYRIGPGKMAVIVHSIQHKQEQDKPVYSFFEPMVQREPDDKQALIRVLTDESALAFWSAPQPRLKDRLDGDFPLHPRPEYLSLRRREYVDWLSTSDPGVTVLWPLVQDVSYVQGRERTNFTVNAQATALHAAAKKMGVRLRTRLFDDDFLAVRIKEEQ